MSKGILCDHSNMEFVSGGKFFGTDESGSAEVQICMGCGMIQVSGTVNGQQYSVSVRIVVPAQVAAIVRHVNIDDGAGSNDDDKGT